MHIIVYIILPGKNTVKDGPVEKGRHKLVGFPVFPVFSQECLVLFVGLVRIFPGTFRFLISSEQRKNFPPVLGGTERKNPMKSRSLFCAALAVLLLLLSACGHPAPEPI